VLAEHATHLLCVRCPESSTKGAWWTEREARRLRKRVLPAVEITCAGMRASGKRGGRAWKDPAI